MRTVLRRAGLVAALAGSLALGIQPASASGGSFAFQGTAHINCFGCGDSPGTATLNYICVDLNEGVVCVYGVGTASYTATESSGVGCLLSGAWSGVMTGPVSVSFNLTRVGSFFVITTAGDVNGAGGGVFQVTAPVGIPCGGPVDAAIVGDVAGT